MLDTAISAPVWQRSRGRAALGVAAVAGGGVRLTRLEQSGSARVFVPPIRTRAGSASDAEAVFLNTSGGLTGGDRLDIDITLERGARLTATTQTAERAYRSPEDAAHVTVRATVGDGARLDWLPQETILFEASHLRRDTRIDLAADAVCLMAETVVLGRHAMGEQPKAARFFDRRQMWRAGRPLWAEALALDASVLAACGNGAVLGGARALAVLAFADQGAEDAAGALRGVLDEPGVEGGASGFDGRCLVRLVAYDGFPLRRQVARLLSVLRPGPLPRVWQI